MNFLESIGVFAFLAWITLIILVLIGWVMNIVALIHMIGGEVGTLFIIRIVGVFVAPLGSILGWFF